MGCISGEMSRRDNTLLTVDFNLRTKNTPRSLQSPAGTTQWEDKVSSLRDCWVSVSCWLLRRLKSTVNKVLSLRDSLPMKRHFYKLFIFNSFEFNSENSFNRI